MNQTPAADQQKPLKEARAQHYVYAHQALRESCKEDALQFFALIASPECGKFLEWIWTNTEKRLGAKATDISVDEVRASTGRIKGFPAIIIQMPPPCAAPEAYMLAVVLIVNMQEKDAPENPEFRYFTLEYSPQLDGGAAAVLGEWMDDKHLNYGSGPTPTMENFIHAIEVKLMEMANE